MKIFNYRYRWYTWLSHYKEFSRLCILFSPSLFLVSGWYFLYYKPIQRSMEMFTCQVQKSNKERVAFYELQNQVLELEKEFEAFAQESKEMNSVSFAYEKIFDSLQLTGVSVIEFQQDSTRVCFQKPISMSMKVSGASDALLKIFSILKEQSLFFVVKSFEILIPKNETDWIMNLHGELFF